MSGRYGYVDVLGATGAVLVADVPVALVVDLGMKLVIRASSDASAPVTKRGTATQAEVRAEPTGPVLIKGALNNPVKLRLGDTFTLTDLDITLE